ncbi:MAG: hypothetical protein KAG97_01985 [Victivallales bacterium]|nr:hypothetical protein [Victivallales bacterium]
MKIIKSETNFTREPLAQPFGFKGGYLSELWQSEVRFEGTSANGVTGLGTQSVLWSDATVFTSNSEAAGNAMMFLATAYGAKLAAETEWENPIELLDKILPEVYEYAKKVTMNPKLRLTFTLNALVAVDNAAWLHYAAEKGVDSFDEMLPDKFHSPLSNRHDKLAAIPLISYNVSKEKIAGIIDDGFFFLKIKIGSDPDGDGDRGKMLQWDMKRLSDIHELVGSRTTPHTENGKIPYYLDANGRYDSKERLLHFIDHADKIGALDRIILLEEPFPEEMEIDVSDIPARLAADESAHSAEDAKHRIQLGYGAIALKPIAKTVSMSLKIAKIAADENIPCFCADLTVNPVLIDWNKNFASRLKALPGMKIGVLETNGHQNYKNWNAMLEKHPCVGAEWLKMKNGVFTLNDDFYAKSGGIFLAG